MIGFNSVAEFSECRKYRYFLARQWGGSEMCAFVMLNPSTADEFKNDPTVERCQRRAAAMGFGSFAVVNIFAWRSTDPSVLPDVQDPIGPMNNYWIGKTVQSSALVICGWGKHGNLKSRGQEVLAFIRETGKVPHALKLNNDGTPAHPLYIGYDVKPSPII